MKFLIAGLGSIGRRHLRNLLALGEREVLLYRTNRSTLPDDELAGFPVESDLQAALDWGPDAVLVCNPTALHLQVAIPAAERGCHLFIEKPISHSWEGVERLRSAVRASGSRVLVGYHFRYHPGLLAVRHLLAEGRIGRVLSVRSHWGEYLPSWHPWEDYRKGYSAQADLGGGVVLTLSHPLDYLLWLFGDVEAAWAFAGSLSELELDVEDTAEIGLRFANGVVGSLHLDYNQRPTAHTLEMIGAHGTLRWDNASGNVSLYQAEPEQGTEANQWQIYPLAALPGASPDFQRNDLFLAEMRHFLCVVRGEAQPVCSLEDGSRALRLALAALQSAREGRLVKLIS